MADHTTCRRELKAILDEARAAGFSAREGWAWHTVTGYEFNGPCGFHIDVKADCLWAAQAAGWRRFMSLLNNEWSRP